MWGTKSRFVVVVISKIGWNPDQGNGRHCGPAIELSRGG